MSNLNAESIRLSHSLGLRVAPLIASIVATSLALPCYAADARQREQSASAPDAELTDTLREEAVAAFDAGEYESALEGFQAAYAESGEPTDLFNIGRIHEELGNLSEALEHYERFVNSPHLQLDERRKAADRIEVLRVLVGEEEDEQEPDRVNFAPASGAASTDRPRDPTQPLIISGAALVGVGVATAAAGGVAFGLRGRRAAEEIAALSPGSNTGRLTLAEAEDLDARGRNAEVLQITFLAAGGVVAGVGATLLGLGLARRKRNAPTLQASASSRHVVVSTGWRF